jgi:hypothetical protein
MGDLPQPPADLSAPPRRPNTEDDPTPVPEKSPAPHLLIDPLTLKGAAFYEAVGRRDLADDYRARRGAKAFGRVLGGITLGVSSAFWVLGSALASSPDSNCGRDPHGASCAANRSELLVSEIAMAVGLGLLVVPAFWSTEPVSDEQKVELVREAARKQTPGIDLRVSAAPLPGGGTVRVGGRF